MYKEVIAKIFVIEKIFAVGNINSYFDYFLRIELVFFLLIEIKKIIVGKVKFRKVIFML